MDRPSHLACRGNCFHLWFKWQFNKSILCYQLKPCRICWFFSLKVVHICSHWIIPHLIHTQSILEQQQTKSAALLTYSKNTSTISSGGLITFFLLFLRFCILCVTVINLACLLSGFSSDITFNFCCASVLNLIFFFSGISLDLALDFGCASVPNLFFLFSGISLDLAFDSWCASVLNLFFLFRGFIWSSFWFLMSICT